jgi:hypothetical protein
MMDQILRWALIEAEEGGQRNFGMPMKVQAALALADTVFGSSTPCASTAFIVCSYTGSGCSYASSSSCSLAVPRQLAE